MENFRKDTAESLKSLPKEERRGQLSEVRRSAEYWAARVDKLLQNNEQKAEFSDDRTTVYWKVRNVFHGTDVSEIETFKFAEESTIGNHAVYFTIDPVLAIGYAKLRNKERQSSTIHLYEAVLSDVKLMNWAERKTVDILKGQFLDYVQDARTALIAEEYAEFSARYHIWPHVSKATSLWALKKIIEACEQEDYLSGGNIKTIAQGVMGIFFEDFVKQKGYDGVITIEGGDDQEFTSKPGISVVIYNTDKISSHRSFNIGDSLNA